MISYETLRRRRRRREEEEEEDRGEPELQILFV